MKTFATLALLGFASAIKLQSEPPQPPIQPDQVMIDETTKLLAAAIMEVCDAD